MEIRSADHPSLRVRAFATTFSRGLDALPTPAAIRALLAADAASPFAPDEALRTGVRDMLRHGGYKPTGRGKPASEYLVKAAAAGALDPINLAADACNAASLHGGFPISVIDLDRANPPFAIAIAPAGTRYVFNRAGQEIDVSGLVCLADADGPCANAVKDAQRTKTDGTTRDVLVVVWGTRELPGRAAAARDWFVELLQAVGAGTSRVRSG